MTVKLAKILGVRQASKMPSKSLELMRTRNLKLNPNLARQLLLHGSDMPVMVRIKNYFFNRVFRGKDKKALEFLIKHSSEKNNPNELSRSYVIVGLSELAFEGKVKETLPGLLIGANDSNSSIRRSSLMGLQGLAELGMKETLPGLLKGINCEDTITRTIAMNGIKALAESGDAKAKEELQRIYPYRMGL